MSYALPEEFATADDLPQKKVNLLKEYRFAK